MDFKAMVEAAAEGIGLREFTVILVQNKSSAFVQFLNDSNTYEQMEIVPEKIMAREMTLTVIGIVNEMNRLLTEGQSKLL